MGKVTIGQLRCDTESGEGSITLPGDFKDQFSCIARADMLRDWLYDISITYDATVAELNKGQA